MVLHDLLHSQAQSEPDKKAVVTRDEPPQPVFDHEAQIVILTESHVKMALKLERADERVKELTAVRDTALSEIEELRGDLRKGEDSADAQAHRIAFLQDLVAIERAAVSNLTDEKLGLVNRVVEAESELELVNTPPPAEPRIVRMYTIEIDEHVSGGSGRKVCLLVKADDVALLDGNLMLYRGGDLVSLTTAGRWLSLAVEEGKA